MFKKILCANRGEIACRVFKSARQMGIATVAVYSEADREALHVQMADESVCIGPAPSAQSYLVADNIIQACLDTGAEAVHPGYGFLSENSGFAERLEQEGIVFIGPGRRAIEAMGDKITSKKVAEEAKVNTIPGFTGVIENADHAVTIANQVGYPVMLKATAGGGGKGMRIARNDEECRDGFERASNEARSSFGDDRVFVEKFIDEPRHIEIQIIADTHGNVVYLGERECSLQRRHQKVIEEAPSPFLDAATRKAMGEQAVALAKAVDYRSAGTVEFIVDQERNFYFLEMNTRLQVEHPVSEWITGQDLVELMIRVAAGERLPITQDQVQLKGWAIESRVYAEDPFRNFLPSVGRLVRYRPPEEGEHVRVDTGVYEGGEVSMFYDPMIAKLITYGKDRETAREHMRRALDRFYIRGVTSNISFLANLIAHPRFVSGEMSTNTIAEEYPEGFQHQDIPDRYIPRIVAVAASVHRRYREREARISGQLPGHERKVLDDWIVMLNGQRYAAHTTLLSGGHDVRFNGRTYAVRSDWKIGDPLFIGYVDGLEVCVQVHRLSGWYDLVHAGHHASVRVLTPRVAELFDLMPVKLAEDMSHFVLSPMPGLLVSLSVEAGQEVKSGAQVAVIEAMKMENVLRAPRDGIVAELHAAVGATLTVDQPIIEFEKGGDDG